MNVDTTVLPTYLGSPVDAREAADRMRFFAEHKAKAPCVVYTDRDGRNPCIPPAILRGMVDRILLRKQVERDNREEAGL